jgi:hypothetical protein
VINVWQFPDEYLLTAACLSSRWLPEDLIVTFKEEQSGGTPDRLSIVFALDAM